VDADRLIADKLHAELSSLNVLASVRVLDHGEWVVRVRRALPRRSSNYPEPDERDEWLAGLEDKLEAASGVRAKVETED
jgi:hypothetical protein